MSPVIISPEVDSIIRAAAQGAAGWLVGAGHLDPTASVTISGIILGIVSLAWSIWQKRHAKATS